MVLKVESFVITYNSIKNGDKLLYGYETIQGKNAKTALKSHFEREFERLYGDAGRYADVIIVKGTFENNTIKYSGRKYMPLCFKAL